MRGRGPLALPVAGTILFLAGMLTAVEAAPTHKCGAASPGEIWTPDGNPYVLDCPVVVPAGVTLTIQAGTIVKGYVGAGGLDIYGSLSADGTGGRIYFTSLRDDDPLVGGDTDGDPNAPARGDWFGILFRDGSTGNALTNIEVRYGGRFGGNIVSLTSSPTLALTIQDSALKFASNSAISLSAPATMGISVQNTTAIGNGINGLSVVGGLITNSATALAGTWRSSSLPYVLSSTVTVPPVLALTIEAGTVVKGAIGSVGIDVYGKLSADGTGGRIYFTSLRDIGHDVLDDTDDTDSTGVTRGDWGGILFHDGSTDNHLINVEVRYGGRFGGNIASLTSSPALALTIKDSALKYASNSAISLSAPATMGISVQSTTAIGNGINGLFVVGGLITNSATAIKGTWLNSSLPYVLSSTVTVPPVLALTIEAGTVVKGAIGSVGIDVYGKLSADGTGGRIYFTSLRDIGHDVLDDTDDTDSTGAMPGNWAGIVFRDGSTDNHLTNVEVRYGGQFGGNIASLTSSPALALTIKDSALKYASNSAIYLSAPATMGISVQSTTAIGNGINGLYVVGGGITDGTTPTAGTWRISSLPYVLSSTVTVPQAVTLMIDPGTIVKGAIGSVGLSVYGTLSADGTRGRIYFTSLRDVDPVVGGDTDDTDSTGVMRGDWGGIVFRDGSTGNALTNVEVRYGGQFGGNIASLTSSPALALTIKDSALKFASNSAIYLTAPATLGISVQNTTAIGNGINGLYVVGGGITDGTTPTTGTWRRSSLPYVLSSTVTVSQALALTIEPGTIVKGAIGFIGLDVYGTLSADGGGGRIYFTSLRDVDPAVGGDTDDTDSIDPMPGNWNGIFFRDGSTGNALTNVWVRYAGGYGAEIYSNSPGLTISESTLSNSSSAGLSVAGPAASVTVASVRFVMNPTGISLTNGSRAIVTRSGFVSQGVGVDIDATSLPILGVAFNDQDPLKQGFNSFACNTKNVCNPDTQDVQAQNNWWGNTPPDQTKFCSPAHLDFTNSLGQEAAPPGGSRAPLVAELMVKRQPPDALVLTWDDVAPACHYDVYRAAAPDATFDLISGPDTVNTNTFTDASGTSSGSPDHYFYSVAVH